MCLVNSSPRSLNTHIRCRQRSWSATRRPTTITTVKDRARACCVLCDRLARVMLSVIGRFQKYLEPKMRIHIKCPGLRGGGGLGKASGISGATPRYVLFFIYVKLDHHKTPLLRIGQVSSMVFFT
ncbi:hypothetical protein PUN28_010995 [Cardiocondyla obscurior]|uniref:Uncharacterized protein n=1 Tax=Cardiocondyla obscurior TaxID=286306 RepID=A0AAW2FKQ2_9HYME